MHVGRLAFALNDTAVARGDGRPRAEVVAVDARLIGIGAQECRRSPEVGRHLSAGGGLGNARELRATGQLGAAQGHDAIGGVHARKLLLSLHHLPVRLGVPDGLEQIHRHPESGGGAGKLRVEVVLRGQRGVRWRRGVVIAERVGAARQQGQRDEQERRNPVQMLH